MARGAFTTFYYRFSLNKASIFIFKTGRVKRVSVNYYYYYSSTPR